MMSIQEVSPEQLAELFHHYRQALATDFHCSGSWDVEAWERLSQQEKNQLVAAARLTLLELSSTEHERADSKRYFAKPGEAEWGC